jgi:hypothetical protein
MIILVPPLTVFRRTPRPLLRVLLSRNASSPRSPLRGQRRRTHSLIPTTHQPTDLVWFPAADDRQGTLPLRPGSCGTLYARGRGRWVRWVPDKCAWHSKTHGPTPPTYRRCDRVARPNRPRGSFFAVSCAKRSSGKNSLPGCPADEPISPTERCVPRFIVTRLPLLTLIAA